jgi:hypothetical protein
MNLVWLFWRGNVMLKRHYFPIVHVLCVLCSMNALVMIIVSGFAIYCHTPINKGIVIFSIVIIQITVYSGIY